MTENNTFCLARAAGIMIELFVGGMAVVGTMTFIVCDKAFIGSMHLIVGGMALIVAVRDNIRIWKRRQEDLRAERLGDRHFKMTEENGVKKEEEREWQKIWDVESLKYSRPQSPQLSSSGQHGLHYRENTSAPCLSILVHTDRPAFSWRSMLLHDHHRKAAVTCWSPFPQFDSLLEAIV